MYLKLKNYSLMNLAVAALVLLVCSQYAKANAYGDLRGRVNGKNWSMKTVTLKKKISDGVLVLEFFGNEILEDDICKSETKSNNILIQIPLTHENGLINAFPDYEAASIQLGENYNQLSGFGYHKLDLKEEELNLKGLAYVSGKLQILSQKTQTEVSGTFKAKVCNSEKNI